MRIEDRLRRWADARERRNGVDGFGQTGTRLLREAADEIEAERQRAIAAENRVIRLSRGATKSREFS